jgi:hypothetical protein
MNNICTNKLNSLLEEDLRIPITNLKKYSPEDFIHLGKLFEENGNDLNDDRRTSRRTELLDLRILWIKFPHFRNFCTHTQNQKTYGISFTNNKQPISAILLGSNGVGKSNIFTALELLYTNQSSIKDKLRGKENFFYYGLNADNGEIDIQAEIGNEKKSFQYSYNKDSTSPLGTIPAAFCSENDIDTLIKGEKIDEYILKQLGYGELLAHKKQLDKLLDDKKEGDISSDGLSYDELSEVAKELLMGRGNESLDNERRYITSKEQIEEILAGTNIPPTFESRWKRLAKLYNVGFLADNPIEGIINKQDETEQMEEKLIQLYKVFQEYSSNDSLKALALLREFIGTMIKTKEKEDKTYYTTQENRQTAIKLQGKLNDVFYQEIKDFKDTFYGFIVDIMNTFSSKQVEEEYIFNIDDPTGRDFSIKLACQSQAIPPKEYLNAFRFKIFCVSIKVAITIQWMKENNTVVPIVLDDIFNANDFENNGRLELFAEKFCKTYHEQLPKFPMQLIVLTHDNLVQESFRRGLERAVTKYPFISQRIFSWRDFEKVSCEPTSNGFINLYLQAK